MPIPAWLEDHCHRLLMGDRELTNLNLNLRKLDTPMMWALTAALKQNSLLDVLNLTSTLSSDASAIGPLARVLLDHHSLRVLHLSHNRLQDVSVIGEAIGTNSSLREVYLDYNLIESPSMVALAQGLCHNTSLRVLQLANNRLGDNGAIALASALVDNGTLQVLGLSRNQIGPKGARALEAALERNVTLVRLDLRNNDGMDERQRARLELLSAANGAGRYLLHQPRVDLGLWARVLERIHDQPDLLFYFLKAKPDVCQISSVKRDHELVVSL